MLLLPAAVEGSQGSVVLHSFMPAASYNLQSLQKFAPAAAPIMVDALMLPAPHATPGRRVEKRHGHVLSATVKLPVTM